MQRDFPWLFKANSTLSTVRCDVGIAWWLCPVFLSYSCFHYSFNIESPFYMDRYCWLSNAMLEGWTLRFLSGQSSLFQGYMIGSMLGSWSKSLSMVYGSRAAASLRTFFCFLPFHGGSSWSILLFLFLSWILLVFYHTFFFFVYWLQTALHYEKMNIRPLGQPPVSNTPRGCHLQMKHLESVDTAQCCVCSCGFSLVPRHQMKCHCVPLCKSHKDRGFAFGQDK